jgi:hypothetical protein
MSAVIALFALSALIGFLFGKSFSWPAIAAASIGLAVLSSVTLQIQGFGAVSGIAIVVTCLTLSQVAYLAAGWTRHKHLFHKEAGKEPGDRGYSEIARKNNQKQTAPSQLA